mgnify:FL=1|tara:strand:+ start:1254 stop:2453 length:1200 start_codon:yes stop_codon:yes gene_type:complete
MTSSNPIERFSLTEADIDADIMESWLEDNIQGVDEKTLFDLQQLISHYSSVIVPNKTVKVSYPTSVDASACADTDNNEVFIPTSSLLKGDIDHTIGLMVHELHHVKLSLKGSEITETCFYLINQILKHTFVGDDDKGWEDLYEVIQSHERITYQTIRKHYDSKMDSEEPTKYENFYLNAIKGIAMFLNCIEDVRIDSLTKPTLKRYIDKGDAICAPHFMEKYAQGEYDEKNLLNVGYRYLFHHKDFLCDDYITETYPDITKLLSATPFEYIKDVFGIYKKELQQFVRECYQDTDCATESGATGNLDALLGDSDEEESGDLQELSKDIKFDEETLGDTKSSNSEPIKQYLEKTEPSFQPISTVLADGIEVMGKVSIHNTVETNVSDNSTFGYATLVVDES